MSHAITRAGFLAVLFLLLALGAVARGLQLVADDLEFRRLDTEVEFWGRDGYTPSSESVVTTVENISALVARSPRQPDYLALQASALAWQAWFSADMDVRMAYNNLAKDVQLSAALSRPAHRHSWSKVVEYASRATEGATALEVAQQRVALLEPVER